MVSKNKHSFLLAVFITCSLCAVSTAFTQAKYPASVEGDFTIKDFAFVSGETLPSLNLHYTVIGKPQTNTQGKITNAVLIMHGTSGSGKNFLSDMFAGGLFGPGQILDAT